MALQIPGGAQVRLIWTISGGGLMINVLGAVVSGTPTFGQAHANALGSAIKGAFSGGALIGQTHTSVVLNSIGVRDLRSPNLTEFLDQGATVAGTGTGDALPRAVALVITLRTALSGPRYRGRIYLGGFSETQNDADATASAALVAAGVSFVGSIQTAMAANGLTMGVISRPMEPYTVTTTFERNDGTTDTTVKTHEGRPGQVNAVTLIQARNDTWDSQRRRTSAGSVSTLFGGLVTLDPETGETTRRGKAAEEPAVPGRR
jgi:hypothetical protein